MNYECNAALRSQVQVEQKQMTYAISGGSKREEKQILIPV